jgi:hypothetical protein
MSGCESGCWTGICEPSHALFTVSGFQTDALVSDYNCKDRPSVAQEARWLEPAVEWPARGGSAYSERQSGSELRGAPTAW